MSDDEFGTSANMMDVDEQIASFAKGKGKETDAVEYEQNLPW